MATWDDLVSYLKSNYKIAVEKPGFLGLGFNSGDGRSQRVIVEVAGNDEIGVWAKVFSPVADFSAKSLEAACREASNLVCGGIMVLDDVIWLSDSIPLANLDANEIDFPLRAVVATADILEQKLTGGDRF